ncbi:MAG: caspase family protein [Marmoricola sp.]|nr:caspase family protein [Marmoricola sp.]
MTRSASTGSAAASSLEGAAARRTALVVAVSEYTDTTLRQLRSPAGDAADFGQVLGRPDLGGFEVTTVLDGRAHEIRLAVEEFLGVCGPEDLALVYLSCHGLVDARRRLYFAAADTLKDRLASTGVEARWLLDQLEECRARRQVVILDCCFSGAFATGTKGDDTVELGTQLLGQGRGRIVLTASRATEYSFEGTPTEASGSPGSVFTAALASGIRTGVADTDNDGYISVDDAYAYAFDAMRSAGAQQTPQRWLYGAEGDIVLAKNPTATHVDPLPTRPTRLHPTGSDPHSASTAQPATGAGWGPPHWWKGTRRAFLIASGVVTLAVAGGAAAGVSAWLASKTDGRDGDTEFSFQGRHVETSVPWHLTISNGPTAPDTGCSVRVREKARSGTVVAATPHPSARDDVILQVEKMGSLYLDYPQGCLVDAVKGRGDADYPVTIPAGVGDSLAWNPSGPMEITADAGSNFPCSVSMVNGESHGIAKVTVSAKGETQRYQPPATSSLYMSVQGTHCAMRAQDASTTAP